MKREETIKWLESLKVEIGRSEHRALWHYTEELGIQNNCIICPRCGKEFLEYEGRKQTNDK